MSGKKRKKKAPRIALCMIVKNEEAGLERCLGSLRGVVSEINVVDTGSTDDTIRIAKRLGANVRAEKWTDDFSHARNISLQMASTEWILALDADEVLSPDAIPKIKSAIRNRNISGFLLPTRNYMDDPTVGNFIPNDKSFEPARHCKGWVESRKVRLFRNHPGIRFEGEIHEVVGPSIRRAGGRTKFLDAVVHHFGYLASESSLKEKTEMMERLAEAKCAARPDDHKAHYELGVISARLGNPGKAEQSFRKSIALRNDFALAHYDLGVILSKTGREEEALEQYTAAVDLDPNNVDAGNNLADSLQRLRRDTEAEHVYRRLLDKHPDYDRSWNNLGALLASKGRLEEAKEAFQQALRIDPTYSDAKQNLEKLRSIKPRGQSHTNPPRGASTLPKGISLCMIVRDEEENLPGLLEQAGRAVDEIVVVDTGSSDATVSVAEKAGARVYEFQWTEDFAAARNFSISKATREWLLVIDADEALSAEDFAALRRLTRNTSAFGFSFETRNYSRDSSLEGWRPVRGVDEMARSFPGWFPSEKVRLFRNTPEIRFDGTIHELVEPSILRAGGAIERARVPIHHYGYDRVSEKAEAYLGPALRKTRARPGSARAHYELGAVFHRLRRFAEACASFKTVLELAPGHVECLIALGDSLRAAGRTGEAEETYRKAIDLKPDSPFAHRGLGIALFNRREFDLSREAFEKTLQLCPHDVQSLTNIGVINARAGNAGEAAKYFNRALEINPHSDVARQNLQKLPASSRDSFSLGLLMIVRNEQDNLAKMLPEIAPCFDEIVIVDTGSNDDTLAIARRHTDNVFEFPWADDFSAARNFGLAKAKADWLLWLDADDRMNPEDAAALREHLLNTEKGYLIRVVSGAGGSGAGEFLQLRLFPNIEGLEWEGRVHEQILPSLQGRGLAAEVLPGATIVHEGYDDPAALRRKSRRNVKLLEKERGLRPDDPYVLQHLAQAYGLLGDIEKAVEVSEALIDAKDIKAPDEFLTHTMNRLAQYCLILNDVERAEMWAERVLEAEPDNRLARYFLGEICYRKGAHGEAVKRFEQFVNAEEVIGCVPVPWRALTANAHNFLGLARERTGQRDKALVEFRRAAELGARVEAHKNLARLYLEDGRPEEAESALRAAVELESDDAVVWTNLGAALARRGKFGEAAEASRKALEIDPACAAARQNLRRLEDRARSMSRPDKSFTPSACMIAENDTGRLKDANKTAGLGAAVETFERSGDSSGTRNNMECVCKNTVAPSQEGCDLSLNMIVKDEEENLREGLAAIAHLFDEIVIVDTGSSDRTAEIAEELGARVVHHQWNDSFADARNAALGNSRGTWIFWLDADDRIESRAVQTLRKFIAKGIPCGALFPIESAIANNGSVVQNYTLRLFPNNPGIEWKGAVHEQIAGSLRSAGIELVNCPDFTIRHVGYEDEGESWEKNLRNLKLLAKELAARPEDPYVLFALAQAFLFCGQVEHATKWLRLLWGLRDKANGDAYREVFWMAGVVLSDCAVKSGNMAEADTWLERAIESYPDNWLPYFQLGERKLLKGELDRAAELLGKAAEIGIGPTLLPLDIEDMRKKLDRYLSELEEAKVNGLLGKTSAKKPMASRKKRKKKKARRRARPDTGRATVSLCMIVKNEEEYLGRCIESARRAVDEIIVVDTGSEDGTAELARRLGAKVYHHPWRNDFAEARNFSIKHASGDWILYLDADEVLTPDACAGIRNLTRKPSAMGYILIQRNYTNDPKAAGWRPCDAGSPEAGGNAGWFPAPIVRLFRNHPAIRFEGAVHELVDHSISRLGGKVELTDIAIHHYGKVRDLDYVKFKQELYLKLGKEKAESRPNDAKAHYELGVQFIELGLLEKGIESLKRSLELETNQPKAHCDLGVALERSGSLQEAADHYARALKLDPENAQAIINLGSAYARLGMMEEASLLFERALAAGPNDPVALNNVGSKLFMQGKFKEAAELYRRAIKANPSYAQAYFNLGTAFEKQGDLAAARSALGRAVELDPTHHESLANLSVVLMRLGLWEEAENNCRKALEIKPDDHVSHNNMGAICHQLGQAECGAEHILTSHEIDPEYEPARQNLAQFEKQCPQLLASLRARRSAKPARSRERKRVIFYHRGMDFDGSTVSARPLGGSESALVYMARELARLGCEVLVFNSCLKPKDCDGVRYLPLSDFAGFAAGQTTDIFVAQRYWQPFLTNLQAGAKIYWVQDAHDQPFVQGLCDPQTSARIDRIFTISEWQTRMFQSEFGLPRSKFFVTRNGFCSDLFAENGATRRPYRLAYTSTPFRGLDVLLDVFPEILKALPEAELHLFTSMAVYGMAKEEDEARYGALYERARQPGVKLRGSVPQGMLARELQECSLMVYPNHFPETSCIAAIEAQAAGAPVVTSRLGALAETVVHGETGICIPGDSRSPQYWRAFVDETVGLLNNRELLSAMSAAARKRAFERYPWGRIAEEWLVEFDRIVAEKRRPQAAIVGSVNE